MASETLISFHIPTELYKRVIKDPRYPRKAKGKRNIPLFHEGVLANYLELPDARRMMDSLEEKLTDVQSEIQRLKDKLKKS
jgi:hypothetical protein